MNDPIQVIVDNGVTWVEVAGLLVGIAVAVTASFAAYVAYSQTKQQIAQAALQHEQQLKQAEKLHRHQLESTLRPLVIVNHLEGGLDNDGRNIRLHMEMWVQNVGPGPAMQVEFAGWVRTPKAGAFDKARAKEIEEIKAGIDMTKPEFRVRFGAIGSNQCLGPISLVPEVAVSINDYAEQAGIMLYIFTYQDVFENQRPSKPPEEWRLGHQTFNRRGTWEKLQH
jgi:hypothetical protein